MRLNTKTRLSLLVIILSIVSGYSYAHASGTANNFLVIPDQEKLASYSQTLAEIESYRLLKQTAFASADSLQQAYFNPPFCVVSEPAKGPIAKSAGIREKKWKCNPKQ